MIRHTSRRASWLLLLTAVIVISAFGGAALAQSNSISIKTPSNAIHGKAYGFTVSGFTSASARLYFFDDVDKCGPNPHVEHAVHNANGDDYQVNGGFSRTSRGWVSPKARTYHVCAYLVDNSEPFNPSTGVLLRAGKKFRVH